MKVKLFSFWVICWLFASASSLSIEVELQELKAELEAVKRDTLFLKTEIKDLKHEEGVSKQKIRELFEENKVIRSELSDLKRDRQQDLELLKCLQSQMESQREDLQQVNARLDDLDRIIEEIRWPINTEKKIVESDKPSARIATFENLNLVATGRLGSVKVYDLRSRQLVRTFNHGGYAYVPFKHNQFILSPPEGSINIWNIETGELVRNLPGDYVTIRVALNKNQSLMLAGGEDSIIRLWDMVEFKEVRKFTGHTKNVYYVVFHEAKCQAISASADSTIRVWNINDGSLVRILSGHTGWVDKILLDEDSGLLYSGSEDMTIKEWDIESGRVLRTLTGHTDGVLDVILSEDRKRIISASGDKSIIIWDRQSGRAIH